MQSVADGITTRSVGTSGRGPIGIVGKHAGYGTITISGASVFIVSIPCGVIRVFRQT